MKINKCRLPVASALSLVVLFSSQLLAAQPSHDVEAGRRLFNDPRFAEFFFRNSKGDVNAPLLEGDPVLENLETIRSKIPSPFRGQTMSCATCHFVGEAALLPPPIPGSVGNRVRVFTDFAVRSPIPLRDDLATHTPRNSPTILGTARPGIDTFLHFDGEFSTAEALALGGLVGRNFGWLASERKLAERHIVQVIREDKGPAWAGGNGTPYSSLLRGIDVRTASDQQVLDSVASHLASYMRSLDFSRDEAGFYDGSPYDLFLKLNGLPQAPNPGEDDISYMKRLADLASRLTSPVWVVPTHRKFKDHDQEFRFGPDELRGLITFTGRAQCVQCHAAPDFTDHLAHNIGVSQEEYDSINGFESFAKLEVPTLAGRTSEDIKKLSRGPVPGQRDLADLGAWSILFNPLMQNAQTKLSDVLCRSMGLDCGTISRQELLDRSLGVFKTPTLRDMGHSDPYMHSGHLESIEDAIGFYFRASFLARRGVLRNADPKLKLVQFNGSDLHDLGVFLRSLNEDVTTR